MHFTDATDTHIFHPMRTAEIDNIIIYIKLVQAQTEFVVYEKKDSKK